MAASLFTLITFSFKYLNHMNRRHLVWILVTSLISAHAIILFYDNLKWIVSEDRPLAGLKLSWTSRLRMIFSRDIYDKNIYYGTWNRTAVVIKEYKMGEACDGLSSNECRTSYLKYVEFKTDELLRSLAVCPETAGFGEEITPILVGDISFHAVTEPLILSVIHSLNKSGARWPVPRILGWWGNVLIEEYSGPSLASLAPVDWKTRVQIAASLLKMARVFTFGDERFSFYFTDMSPDNIAIGNDMTAVLIDLDHVIVVDKTAFGDMKSQHISEVTNQQESGISFSTEDICKHPVSDFNYYSICEHIFRRSPLLPYSGLLAELPTEATENYPTLNQLLDECATGGTTGDRISAGKKLESIFQGLS